MRVPFSHEISLKLAIVFALTVILYRCSPQLETNENETQALRDRLTITFVDDSLSRNFQTVEVCGFSADELKFLKQSEFTQEKWQAFFKVFVASSEEKSSKQELGLLGDYTIDECLRFQPRFALMRGVSYNARVDFSELDDPSLRDSRPMKASFLLPENSATPTTFVTSVYPSAAILPENLLKFYIQFSAPMSRGLAYQNIRILDRGGSVVEKAYVEIEPELWDFEQRRFTLLFDPGRIKRGLRPHDEMGAPLQAGKKYTLVIDSAWQDGKGVGLKKTFEKKFEITSADRRSPKHTKWEIISPAKGARSPLKLILDEPLDSALLLRFITVLDDEGLEITGKIDFDDDEQVWLFQPDQPWKAGEHRLKISSRIEDLAGNTLMFLFDEDLENPSTGVKTEFVELPFLISDN